MSRKLRFVLKHILSMESPTMRPATLAETYERIIAGEEHDMALSEFLDTFYLAPTPERRMRNIASRAAADG